MSKLPNLQPIQNDRSTIRINITLYSLARGPKEMTKHERVYEDFIFLLNEGSCCRTQISDKGRPRGAQDSHPLRR